MSFDVSVCTRTNSISSRQEYDYARLRPGAMPCYITYGTSKECVVVEEVPAKLMYLPRTQTIKQALICVP